MLVTSPKLHQDDTAHALGENKQATTPGDPVAQATAIWSLLTRFGLERLIALGSPLKHR